MVNVRMAGIITVCGLLAWSLITLGTLTSIQGIFSLISFLLTPSFPWEREGPKPPSISVEPQFAIMFWLLVVSWLGAWLAFFGVKFLIPHARLEADQLIYVGAILAMFPFALPLIPFFYLRLKKAAEKERKEPEI
jgi:hypothetical protein